MPSIERIRPWLLPVGVMACLVVILMPLPAPLMDFLLAGNIALAVLILLTAIHVASPLEFSVFPTLLLATTLSRLVLNIATTRLILTNAPTAGEQAAGGVIQAFGQFVAGNQVIVGLVIFLILVVIQFVVITKGATRVSEVAARFALDGMPGRQSAIDADLNAGNIDAAAAAERRESLIAEADFFAAMDGASKFVRGDAVAGLVITAINIVGGLCLGVIVSGMDVSEAASVFTKLTIGDGLVSQLPSLLISLAAGFLVTRGTRKVNLPDRLVSQLLGNATSLFIAGGFLIALMATGLPKIPLLLLGAGCLLIASSIDKQTKQRLAQEKHLRETEAEQKAPTQKRVEDFLSVDPLEVAIGLGLLPLADPGRGGDLMQRIAGLRNQMAAEIGIVLPKVRVRDDASLGQQEYEIRLFGDFIARGELRIDGLLASPSGTTTGVLEGEAVTAPSNTSTGQPPALWIEPGQREQALIYGYATRTAPAVLADHLEQLARAHADELLSHDATKHLLDELRQVAPAMVEELVPNRLTISDVQKVLQGLLCEGIPIRQLGIIMEALGETTRVGPPEHLNPEMQIETVRQKLARTLCAQFRDDQNVLRAVVLNTEMTHWFQSPASSDVLSGQGRGANEQGAGYEFPTPDNKTQDVTCDAIRQAVKKLTDGGFPPVILVGPSIRRHVKLILDRSGIWAHVMSTNEITSDTQLEFLSTTQPNAASIAA